AVARAEGAREAGQALETDRVGDFRDVARAAQQQLAPARETSLAEIVARAHAELLLAATEQRGAVPVHRLRELVHPEQAVVELRLEHLVEASAPALLGRLLRGRRRRRRGAARELVAQPTRLRQQALHAREQLAAVERLLEIIVRAGLKP